jgi:hypothetical protein
MTDRRLAIAAMLAALAAVAAAYWPVLGGALVWDDLLCLRDQAWLRGDDAWQRVITADFCGWSNYFRPVAVTLFVFDTRSFGLDPAPMHALSLGLHMADTLLVGLIARTLSADRDGRATAILPGVAMMLYGLHPALTEPVAWISAQTELAVTFFMLLGILLNFTVRRAILRAIGVAACFLLAACSKESAISLAFLIPILDWLMLRPTSLEPRSQERLRLLWQQQQWTYLGIFFGGLAYLALRFWALGYILHSSDNGVRLAPFAHVQEVAWSYLAYWRILLWPMVGLNPVHLIDQGRFATLSANSVLFDLGALAIVAFGAVTLLKRSFVGALIAVVTVSLLPVLHILPIGFDESLYHERYAMMPLAAALALLPGSIANIRPTRIVRIGISVALALWLVVAVANIRVTLPLWAEDTSLWQWALRANPTSVSARENLLASYIAGRNPRADDFADALVAEPMPCQTCLLNVAYFSMSEGNSVRARAALTKLDSATNVHLRQASDVARAHLDEMQGDPVAAERTYREAEALDPREPMTKLQLALFLAQRGHVDESRRLEESALQLFAPDQRAQRRKEFEEAVLEKRTSATPN